VWVLILCLLATCPAKGAEPPPLSQEGEEPGGAIKLTRPDGTPIYVNPHAVAFVRGPLPGEHGHTTIVFASGAKQTVLESVEEIGNIMDEERNR
jgi:uncharacterized protein YlzI (FlbEa/FlbD family)